MRTYVKFEGIDGLKKALDSDIKRARIKEAVKQNTAELTQKAQKYCPVDTGTLRRGIISSITDGGLTGEVRNDVNYAPYQEYGTRYMSPQPFFKPALEEQSSKFTEDLKKAIGN